MGVAMGRALKCIVKIKEFCVTMFWENSHYMESKEVEDGERDKFERRYLKTFLQRYRGSSLAILE